MDDRPSLRPLDIQPVIYQDQQMWLLRDPLELTDYQLILTPTLAQLLVFCNGQLDARGIQAAYTMQFGIPIELELVEDILAQLDQVYLLDNQRAQEAIRSRLAQYRNQDHRPPTLAGLGYPDDPKEVDAVFKAYGQGDDLTTWQTWSGRGVISPHIDYPRGGPVYAQVWHRVAEAVKQAEMVLIFGTDHNGSPGSITLTQIPYATPYGILPMDSSLVESLAEAIGPEAYAQELHHRKEHSVELSAVWLHYMRAKDPCPMIPILCGSFHQFVENGSHPADDPQLNAFIETLQRETTGKKVLAVASVDLAHVGPNFGDEFDMDARRREALAESDASLMEAIAQGDSERFYQEVATVEDRNRICGFSSIYLMLRYLGSTTGRSIAYDQCPADDKDTSLVSICGMLLE